MGEVFKLPDLGEGLAEAEIVAWHVGVGDHVVTGQPLVSVETDKAVVEVPSPQSGHIAALHGEAGDVIAVGAPLVEFAEGEAEDKGAVVGDIPKAARARSKAAPALRALAKDLGVDLASVRGPARTARYSGRCGGGGERVRAGARENPGVRRAMLRNMVRAGAEVVPATVTDEADIECWPAKTDVTVRLVRASGRRLQGLALAERLVRSRNRDPDPACPYRSRHRGGDRGRAVCARSCATSAIAAPTICAAAWRR